ncbi:MAG TPA: carboxymuconolactone decarboxylase family protein [Dissulfurispiraceae bacterium]|nr:carboxymuconolactone decarboxylase family protein [Dissulfurispiraceae bacterium]
MNTRMKELIAIGASVTANCRPCLTYHVGKAREAAVTEEEIREAIAIAKLVRKGAMSKMDQFVPTVIEASEAAMTASDGGCGCGK